MKKKVTLNLEVRTVLLLRKAAARRKMTMSAVVDELVEANARKEIVDATEGQWLHKQ